MMGSIDNPDQVERLMARLQQEEPGRVLPPGCEVTSISYADDEGGIVCRLGFGGAGGGSAVFASITHLRFDARLPLAREIAAYQNRRVKRIRRAAQ